MPKIYEESTIQMVWNKINKEGLKRRELAKQLGLSTKEIDQIYEAGRRRWGQFENLENQTSPEGAVQKLIRPKAVYSNYSPYSIQPGINTEIL